MTDILRGPYAVHTVLLRGAFKAANAALGTLAETALVAAKMPPIAAAEEANGAAVAGPQVAGLLPIMVGAPEKHACCVVTRPNVCANAAHRTGSKAGPGAQAAIVAC